MSHSNTLLDEFGFLLEEDETPIIEDLTQQYIEDRQCEKDSLQYIKTALQFKGTYNGISSETLLNNIEVKSTEVMPWRHTVMYLDNNLFVDIAKSFADYFEIPTYIEEIGERQRFDIKINNIKQLIISENIVVIQSCALSALGNLESLHIKKGSQLMVLYPQAFACIDSLRKLNLVNATNLQEIPKELFKKSPVKQLIINGTIEKIHYTNLLSEELKEIKVVYTGLSEETGVLVNKTYTYTPEELLEFKRDSSEFIWLDKGIPYICNSQTNSQYKNEDSIDKNNSAVGELLDDTVDLKENSSNINKCEPEISFGVGEDFAGWDF